MLTRNSPLWQPAMAIYNTHGVQEQLKLLQGLGSLLRHQINAIHNKVTKILVLWTAVLYLSVTCFNRNKWSPWMQTTWRSSRQWFWVVYFGI